MAYVMQQSGRKAIEDNMGVDATGQVFNSINAIEQYKGKEMNPLVNPGAIAGAPADSVTPSNLPTNEMCPIGYSHSREPKYKSFTASVFWNTVGFGQRETAIRTELIWPM